MLNIKNKNHTHTIIVLIHTYRDYDETSCEVSY